MLLLILSFEEDFLLRLAKCVRFSDGFGLEKEMKDKAKGKYLNTLHILHHYVQYYH